MAEGLEAVFRKPFLEQIAAYRARLGDLVPTSRWDDIERASHDRAFMVAGAMKADLLKDLGAAVDRAISDGVGFETFKADFLETARRHGWNGWTGQGTKAGEHWRARVVYRTNLRTTYAAGRLAQLRAGGFRYWIYRHGGSLDPREEHLGWDGLILEPTHPFWSSHAPPNGWGCSCYILGARSMAGAVRLGGDPSKVLPANWQDLDPRTGAPAGLDRGWDYAPGASVSELVSFAADKMRALPDPLAADYGKGLSGLIERAWAEWMSEIEARDGHRPGLVGLLGLEDVARLRAEGFELASVPLHVRPDLVAGSAASLQSGTGDALSRAAWLSLPRLVRDPEALLVDTETNRVLMLLRATDAQPQLAIALDRDTKAVPVPVNEVVSAYQPNLAELRRRLSSGRVRLIRGALE